MLATPRIFQVYKSIVIGIAIICHAASGGSIKKVKIFNAIGFNLAFCVFGTFIAIINNNIDKFDYAKVNILWYVLLIFVFFLCDSKTLFKVVKTIIWTSIYIVIYNILLLLHAYGTINFPLLTLLDATANVGFHVGYVHIVSTNISMLMFTMPLIFSLVIYASKDFLIKLKIKRETLLLCLFLNFFIMILSGRRIMWIYIVFLILILAFVRFSKDKASQKRRGMLLFFGLIGIIVALFYLVQNDGALDRLLEIFSKSDNIRFVQIRELWKGFLESPIWGVGFGRGVGNSIPGYENSTMYEVTYNLLLYNTGIIGISLYVTYIVKIITMLLQEIKKCNSYKALLISALVGFLVILFGNATNPYLGSSFDFHIFQIFPLWLIYISQSSCSKVNIERNILPSLLR